MKISDFVTSLSGGIARTNRYSVVMDIPSVDGSGLTPLSDLLIFCDQVQLPGLNIQTAPNRTYGEVRETPYEFAYEPINFTFYADAGMHLNAYFSAWIKSIQYNGRRSFRYYDQYICPQMQILVQDTEDDTRYQVTLYECYPKSIGAIQLDYASKDVMKIPVTMIYKYWEYSVIDKPARGAGGQIGGRLLARGLVPGVDFWDENEEPDIEEIYPVDDQRDTDEWGDMAFNNEIPASGNNTRGLSNNGTDPLSPDNLPSQGNDSNPFGEDYQGDLITADGQTTAEQYQDANPLEEEFSGYEGDDELDF
jgi:hypothetical protein